ncbi:MAG TPA: hypothetical protein VFA96_02160, partial [Nocardioides sp.]|nr:hypothetical protein [Nocardioides sp.]
FGDNGYYPRRDRTVRFHLADSTILHTDVVLSGAAGTLALKAGARSVCTETRDAQDLWRCLEIAAAAGVTPELFTAPGPLHDVARVVHRELGPGGHSLPALTAELHPDAAARLRTRLRGLLAEVLGVIS